MKFLSIFFVLICSFSVYAANQSDRIRLDIRLDIDGKHYSTETVTVKFNEKTALSAVEAKGKIETLVDVVAKDKGNNQVEVEAVITKLINNEPKQISRPRVITIYGQSAEISVMNEQQQGLRLKVKASRL